MTADPLLDRPPATAADIAASEMLLTELLHTRQDVILLQGEAVLGLEAAARGLGQPGTRALNIVTVPYGKLFGDWLRASGTKVRDLVTPFDAVAAPAAVADELARQPVGLVSVVHAEAATGGLNPLGEIASVVHAAGALLVVDAVASIGADPVTPDDWDADVVVIGPQKALAGPAGLSAASVSERAWRAMEHNPSAPRGSYLSLLDIKHRWLDTGRRALPGYVASLECLALAHALERVAAEGLDAVIARHAAAAAASRAGLRTLGLRPWIDADTAAAGVATTFAAPAGQTAAEFAVRLRSAGATITAAAPGPLADRALRINHTGRAAEESLVRTELARFTEVLRGALTRWPRRRGSRKPGPSRRGRRGNRPLRLAARSRGRPRRGPAARPAARCAAVPRQWRRPPG
jgi:aspartate aminotransferase-like enzyme